jgi:hypothetical protein
MVLLNAVFIGFSTLRSVGAVLLLKMVSSTVMTFFGWQIITLLFQAFFMAIVLWRNLPASDHAPVLIKMYLWGSDVSWLE